MKTVGWLTASMVVVLSPLLKAEKPPQAPPVVWLSPVDYPRGMARYESAAYTQEIAVTNGRDRISPVLRSSQKAKWQFSGGLEEVWGWRSEKYKLLPEPPKTWIGTIQVLNSFGHYQPNRGILRSYAVGTRFDDLLISKNVVFEHRMREKTKTGWQSRVLYLDKEARPSGYRGLKVSCSSCHNEAGSGGYAEGLVPGGDTVLSDPLDWNLARGYE